MTTGLEIAPDDSHCWTGLDGPPITADQKAEVSSTCERDDPLVT